MSSKPLSTAIPIYSASENQLVQLSSLLARGSRVCPASGPGSPGEAFQFDWSCEYAFIGGLRRRLEVVHIKLTAISDANTGSVCLANKQIGRCQALSIARPSVDFISSRADFPPPPLTRRMSGADCDFLVAGRVALAMGVVSVYERFSPAGSFARQKPVPARRRSLGAPAPAAGVRRSARGMHAQYQSRPSGGSEIHCRTARGTHCPTFHSGRDESRYCEGRGLSQAIARQRPL